MQIGSIVNYREVRRFPHPSLKAVSLVLLGVLAGCVGTAGGTYSAAESQPLSPNQASRTMLNIGPISLEVEIMIPRGLSTSDSYPAWVQITGLGPCADGRRDEITAIAGRDDFGQPLIDTQTWPGVRKSECLSSSQ